MKGAVALLAVTNGDAHGDLDGPYMYLHNLINSTSATSHILGFMGLARTGCESGKLLFHSNSNGGKPSIPLHSTGTKRDIAS